MAPVIVSVAPATSRNGRYKSRHIAELANIPFIGRTTLLARFQQAAAQAPPDSQFPKLMAFGKTIKWLALWLKDLFHKNVPYPTYPPGKTGIFQLPSGPIKIAVAADWGTGTMEAETVAANMSNSQPDFTIHLGDVYYMGEKSEVEENCLGCSEKGYKGVVWPSGLNGKFALMGNHEMYSGGQAYVNNFLPTLGTVDVSQNVLDNQSASYFCLVTDHWIILGLDTGYHSGGIAPLASVPLINQISSLNVDAHFDPKMITWLQQTIATVQALGNSAKSVLILTHHQPYSAFEHAFTKPAEQLAGLDFLNGTEFVWLFGHEHRFTVYTKQPLTGSITAYPRCIGHGGMPVDSSEPKKPNVNIQFYDPRVHPIDVTDTKTMVGFNGYAMLKFADTSMSIEYHTMEYDPTKPDTLLLTETFTPGLGGKLDCTPKLPAPCCLYTGQKIPA